jgi:hypothetical protein
VDTFTIEEGSIICGDLVLEDSPAEATPNESKRTSSVTWWATTSTARIRAHIRGFRRQRLPGQRQFARHLLAKRRHSEAISGMEVNHVTFFRTSGSPDHELATIDDGVESDEVTVPCMVGC